MKFECPACGAVLTDRGPLGPVSDAAEAVVKHQLEVATATLQGVRLEAPEIEHWLRNYAKSYLGKDIP